MPDFHRTDDQLEAYALGRLGTSDQPGLELLEEHLMICSTCRDRLEGVEAFASGMKDAFGSKLGNSDFETDPDLFAWLRRGPGLRSRWPCLRSRRRYFPCFRFGGPDSIRPGGELAA